MKVSATALTITASLLSVGCSSSRKEVSFARPYRHSPERRDAVREILIAQLDAQQGDLSMSSTVLEGVRKAFERGGGSRDMAVFWTEEIDRRFVARIGTTRAALASEVAEMSDAEADAILVKAQPGVLRRGSRQLVDGNYRHAIEFTLAYRAAKVAAQCESLVSTPAAWDAAHPDGPRFDFAGNGIDIRQAERQCPSHEARP